MSRYSFSLGRRRDSSLASATRHLLLGSQPPLVLIHRYVLRVNAAATQGKNIVIKMKIFNAL